MAKRGSKASSVRARDAGPPGDPVPLEETPPAVEAFARLHVWQIQAVRDVLVVAVAVGLIWIGYALRAVTVPLLVALLLAYLCEPIVARLCRHPRITRPYAVGGLLAAGVIAVLLLAGLMVPLVAAQTTQLLRYVAEGELRARAETLIEARVPEKYEAELMGITAMLPARAEEPAPADGADVAPPPPPGPAAGDAVTREEVERLIEDRLRAAGPVETTVDAERSDWVSVVRRQVAMVGRVLRAIVEIGLLTFLIPFYFFFFSLWYPDVVRFGRDLIPTRNRERTLELLAKMDRVIAGFVRGRIVISLIMGVLLAIGWMACGVPYAIMLGFVVGIFCAVPYLGIIGIPVAVGLLAFEQLGLPAEQRMGWLWVLLLPTGVFAIVQLIEGYVLTPAIAGKATNLDPVTILVAVLAGGSVLGVYGMLLAIPAAACTKILLVEILFPKIHAWLRGEAADPLPIDRR